MHDVHQDTGLSTSLGTNTIQELSSSANNSSLNTDHQTNQFFMNKDFKYIHTSSTTVSSATQTEKLRPPSKKTKFTSSIIVGTFDSPKSALTVSHNNSDTSPVISCIRIFPNTAEGKSQSRFISSATQTENLSAPKGIMVQGRRIIDFEYFFNALKIINKHSTSGCSLNDIIITREKKIGLHASYDLKCTVCEFEDTLWTECPTKLKNINTDTVAGMLSINCNFWFMNKILLKMNLPCLSRAVLIKERDKISSDEVKGGIKITDQNLKFPILDDKSSKECEKTSESSHQIESRQASTSLNKKIRKITKANSNLVEKKQKFRPVKNVISTSLDKNKDQQQVNLNRLLIKDEFEIERNSVHCESEPELLSPNIRKLNASSTSPNKRICKIPQTNSKFVVQKQKSKPSENLISASIHKNENDQQGNLNRLLIEDKFEIETNSAYHEFEPELLIPHNIELKTSSGYLVTGTEQANFDVTRTKQNLNSEVYDDKLTRYKNNEMEILNYWVY